MKKFEQFVNTYEDDPWGEDTPMERTFHDWFLEKYPNKNPKEIRIIYCSSQQLISLEGIENSTNLQTLSCSNNPGLTSLKGIENLRNLRNLYCYNNLEFSREYKDYLKNYCSERKIKLAI